MSGIIITNTPWGTITLEGLLHAEIVAKQLNVAFLTCIIWELITTVDQSIDTFWNCRWTIYKFMFYFNQFEAIVVMVINMLMFFMPSPSNKLCISLSWAQLAGTSSIVAVVNYILISRVYALWDRSRHVFLICLCGFILNVGIYIGSSAYLVSTSSDIAAPLPFTGCQITSSFKYEYACLVVSIGFETMIIFLIVIKSYHVVQLRSFKAPLFSLLFEDGVAFYCAIVISQTLTLVGWVAPSLSTFPMLESFPSFFVIVIACNRLLLRSQRLLQRRYDLPTTFTSRGVAVAAGITAEFHHQDNSHQDDDLELDRIREEKVQTQAKTPIIETGSPPTQSLEKQEGQHRSILPTITCDA